MKGIDISSHNASIDFDRVKNDGVEIVYIKATEGRSYINPLMKSQYNEAVKAGLHIGFYHYMRTNDPEIEAEFFLKTVKDYDVDCRFVVDIEDSTLMNNSTADRCNRFINYLKSNGKEAMVYSGDYFYRDYLKGNIKDTPVWIANYSSSSPLFASGYYGFQYTDKGKIDGVNGFVDLNSFDEKIIFKNDYPTSDSNDIFNYDPIMYGYVTANQLNVRDGAGTNYDIIGGLKKGTVVKIDKRYSTDSWYSIYYGDHGGFLSTDYVSLKSPVDSESYIMKGVVTASVLNVREGAGTHYRLLGTIKNGTIVKIDKRYSVAGWYSIYYGQHGGFVSADYIRLN